MSRRKSSAMAEVKCQVSLKLFFLTCQRHPKNTGGCQITMYYFTAGRRWWGENWSGVLEDGAEVDQNSRRGETLRDCLCCLVMNDLLHLLSWLNGTRPYPSAGCPNTHNSSRNSNLSLGMNCDIDWNLKRRFGEEPEWPSTSTGSGHQRTFFWNDSEE